MLSVYIYIFMKISNWALFSFLNQPFRWSINKVSWRMLIWQESNIRCIESKYFTVYRIYRKFCQAHLFVVFSSPNCCFWHSEYSQPPQITHYSNIKFSLIMCKDNWRVPQKMTCTLIIACHQENETSDISSTAPWCKSFYFGTVPVGTVPWNRQKKGGRFWRGGSSHARITVMHDVCFMICKYIYIYLYLNIFEYSNDIRMCVKIWNP